MDRLTPIPADTPSLSQDRGDEFKPEHLPENYDNLLEVINRLMANIHNILYLRDNKDDDKENPHLKNIRRNFQALASALKTILTSDHKIIRSEDIENVLYVIGNLLPTNGTNSLVTQMEKLIRSCLYTLRLILNERSELSMQFTRRIGQCLGNLFMQSGTARPQTNESTSNLQS